MRSKDSRNYIKKCIRGNRFGCIVFVIVVCLLLGLLYLNFRSEIAAVDEGQGEPGYTSDNGETGAADGTVQGTDLGTGAATGDDDTYYLPVIETTDIHGYMIDISSGNEDTYQYRLAYIAGVIDHERENGDILLLDTGDCYQGNAISGRLDGQPVRAYLDACDYDAVCLGNHEFDWGLGTVIDEDATVGSWDISDDIGGDSDIPVLCWDLYDSSTGEKTDFTQDYIIAEKTAVNENGQERAVRIAIFGYVNDYSSSVSDSDFEGYEIHEDDMESMEACAGELEESGLADASVLLCHAGPEEMDGLMSEASAFDLVVCGHTHDMDSGTLSNGVPYILAGSYGRAYARAVLAIKGSEVNVSDSEVIQINTNPDRLYDTPENEDNFDAEILRISHAALDKVKAEYPDILEGLGYVTENITNDRMEGSVGENEISDWAAELIADAAGAQVGVVNSTGVRSEIKLSRSEDRHVVTESDIYTMFPFENSICEYELTYEQLLELCSHTNLNDHSFLAVSGVKAYLTDSEAAAHNGDRYNDLEVSRLWLGDSLIYDNGWKKDKNTLVSVAVNSYVADFDNLVFKDMEPVNRPDTYPDAESCIAYLRENYGAGSEIPVDTEVHLVDASQ